MGGKSVGYTDFPTNNPFAPPPPPAWGRAWDWVPPRPISQARANVEAIVLVACVAILVFLAIQGLT